MSQPTGVILSATFEFTKAGALYDPSPLPTLIDARYPDATAPSLVGLSHPSTGVFTANVFTALQSTQVGTYSALAYTSDATTDRQYAGYEWVDVGINNVTSVPANSSISFNAPSISGGAQPLVIGRSYLNAYGNAITFTVSNLNVSLQGAGITTSFRILVGMSQPFAGVATSATAGYVEIPASASAKWLPGTYTTEFVVLNNGDPIHIASGTIDVINGIG